MKNKKLVYRQYDEEEVLYSNEYAKHVSAMTGEQLHSKSEIAAELASRDIRIKELEAKQIPEDYVAIPRDLFNEVVQPYYGRNSKDY